MYTEHPSILTPEPNLVIWRYMDLWKLLDILDYNRLYLTQVIQFEDQLEGRLNYHRIDSLSKDHIFNLIDNFSKETLIRENYIQCWTAEKTETYHMWKVYSDYRSAVAIKTTIADLKNSLIDEEQDVYIGQIEYINPQNNYFFRSNAFQLFFEKRMYFSFENEVRILTVKTAANSDEINKLPDHVFIKVNPKILIKEIKLAPLASESFKTLVELKLKNLNLDIPVTFSEI